MKTHLPVDENRNDKKEKKEKVMAAIMELRGRKIERKV